MKRDHYFLRIILGLLFFSFIIILLPSCATEKKKVKKDPFFDKWKVKAEKSKGHSPTIKRRVIDLPESKEIGPVQKPAVEIKKSLPTKNISLRMHNIELAVLIRTLARAADIDIVINESVKGKTNIYIKNQPWDQIFSVVLKTNGLTYSWMGNIIRIMTLEDKELELKGRELDLKRKALQKNFKMFESLIVSVVEIDYADINNLKANLIDFLTKGDDGKVRGSIKVDSHTNSLIIHAIRSDIERMIPLIEALDRPTRQVLIEAHIVQARRTISKELGITWSGTRYTGAGGGAASDNLPTATGSTFDSASSATGLVLGYYTQKLGKYALDAQLTALESDGKLKVLSSPTITTVDNMKAIIQSGKEVPYNILDDAGNTTTAFKEAVLQLEVTPHIIDSNTLSLKIKIKKDAVDPDLTVGGVPALITKKAETKVILFNGQTTVIGGLNEQDDTDTNYGTPFLQNIPLLGYLFKGMAKESVTEDLLIFITPYILEEYTITEPQ